MCGTSCFVLLPSPPAEYSESGSSEDETSPCDKVLTSRKGFSDFRVKSLKHSSIGRKVIGIAEQGEWLGVKGHQVRHGGVAG